MEDKLIKLSHKLNELNLLDDAMEVVKLAQDRQITDKDVIIATLVGEASVDGTEGMSAVYSVIKNRAAHKNTSMKNICLEPKQFSMWNDKTSEEQRKTFIKSLIDVPGGLWIQAERIVNSDPGDTTYGSTHYYTGSTPGWASSRNPCWIYRVKVGSHTFGIDLSNSWVNVNSLPPDILKAYLAEGRQPARCYIDRPNRYPPQSIRKIK